MNEHIEAQYGWVEVSIGSSHEDIEPERYTPAEARELAARILTEADKCEAQKAAIEAACADGHDWSSGYNGYQPWPDRKVVSFHCKREGCNGRKVEEGWIEFAGQLHIRFGRQVDCLGPGCEYCYEEQVGKAIHQVIADGVKELEATVFGYALGGPDGHGGY